MQTWAKFLLKKIAEIEEKEGRRISNKEFGVKLGYSPGTISLWLNGRVTDEASNHGVVMPVFEGVNPNPTEQNVVDGLARYVNEKCDGIVGLGGGSPLDAAKAIRLRVTHKLPLEEYDDLLDGGNKISNSVPPFIAIATTAGTGSDVSRSTVITLKATDRKTVIFSPYLIPSVAIADPGLTVSMPPGVTANRTGCPYT